MSFEQVHEMEGTLGECLRELSQALGPYDYEMHGDRITVRDRGRTLMINLGYEGDRSLGSLDLPMTQVSYEFIDYTQEEMDAFMDRLSDHMMRGGG